MRAGVPPAKSTIHFPHMPHYVYLARCSDGSLYAGTCLDLAQREATHNAGKGAKYTRSRLPVSFVYHERHRTLSAARKREAALKAMTRAEKAALVATNAKRSRLAKRAIAQRKHRT